MADFTGTMRIEGGGQAVPVKARVDKDVLTLEVEGVEVGEWPVADLDPAADAGGVVLRLGDEAVTLDVSDRIALLSALKPAPDHKAGRGRRKERGRKEKHGGKAGQTRRRRRPSLVVVLITLLALAAGVAAFLAPEAVGSVALLVGLLTLVVGGFAHSDPRIALRLPLNLHPVHFIVAGLVALVGGAVLVIVG
ncbi:MAG: hypothetical protein ACLFWM_01280 [Actinomycetota bacterium]